MNKIILTIFLGFAITAFQNHPAFEPLPFKIKDMTNLKTGSSTLYTYNSEGKILTAHSSLGPTTGYRYIGNLVIKQLSGAGKTNSQTDTFRLNTRGLADVENDRNSGQTNEIKLKYDPNNFLTQSKQFVKGNFVGGDTWVISDGNRIKYTSINDKNTVISSAIYTYYPDKTNTIGDNSMGIMYRGRDSKNLMKESIGIGEKGDTVSLVHYNYKLDNRGRVSEKVAHTKSGALLDSTAYTYY